MARRKRNRKGQFTKGGGRRRKAPKRRRRNPGALSLAPAYNPRRRRRRSTARRKVYRRNPGARGMFKGLLPDFKDLGGGVGGAMFARLVPKMIAVHVPQIPIPTEGPGKLGAAAVAALASGMVARPVLGKRIADAMVLGGLIHTLDQAVQLYIEPALGLSAYMALDAYTEADDDALIGYPTRPQIMTGPGDEFDTLGAYGPGETVSRLSPASRF